MGLDTLLVVLREPDVLRAREERFWKSGSRDTRIASSRSERPHSSSHRHIMSQALVSFVREKSKGSKRFQRHHGDFQI